MRTKSEWTFDVYLNDDPVRTFKQVASTAKYVATLNSTDIVVLIRRGDQLAYFRTANTGFLPEPQLIMRITAGLREYMRKIEP